MAATSTTAPDIPAVASIEVSDEHAAVRNIVASKHFLKAPLLSSFLLYVSQCTLDEGMARISEYEIGMTVFKRDGTFDPRQDNIVRTYARHLRSRLRDYYGVEGQNDPIRVELPKGTYVPVFHRVQSLLLEVDQTAASLQQAELVQLHSPVKPGKPMWLILTAAVLLLVGYSVGLWRLAAHTTSPAGGVIPAPKSSSHQLWTQVFSPNRDTFVVPGDIGFVVVQQANRRTFSLTEYLSWFSGERTDGHLAMSYLKDQTYTSMLNLGVVLNLQQLPEVVRERFIVRAVKNMRLDDFRNGDAIILGSNYSNPWTELFADKLDFRFVNRPQDNRFWIVNQHPGPGEAGVYESTTTAASHRTYAVVAFVRNLSRSGHVLLLQGLDATGTQAAADMLFSGDELQKIVQSANQRHVPVGSFEFLIEIESLDANSHPTGTRVVASRFFE